jgi:hypothetical protein
MDYACRVRLMLGVSSFGLSIRDLTLSADHQTTTPSHAGRPSLDILWLQLSIVFCLLLLTRLVQQTMTIDGTLDVAIARNLTAGDGALWHLRRSGLPEGRGPTSESTSRGARARKNHQRS